MIRRLVSPDDLSSSVWAMYYDDDNARLFVMYVAKEKHGEKEIRTPGQAYKYTSVPMGYADVLETEAKNPEGSVGSLLYKLITSKDVSEQFPYTKVNTLPDFLLQEVDAYNGQIG